MAKVQKLVREPGTSVTPQSTEALPGDGSPAADAPVISDGAAAFDMVAERNRVLVTSILVDGATFRCKFRDNLGNAFMTGWSEPGGGVVVLPCATGATLRVWSQTSADRKRGEWVEIGSIETPKQSHRGLSLPAGK